MIFVFGGAYQGKREYIKETYNLSQADIFVCPDPLSGGWREGEWLPDLSKRAVCGLEHFSLACVKQGLEARDWLSRREVLLRDIILTCTDLSQGVVPMDAELRAWREMNGRMMIYLAGAAEEVYRIFCGIPQKIK